MSAAVCVILAPGFEEIEALTPVDMLRRAGAAVTTAGLAEIRVTGSHGIEVTADTLLDQIKTADYDMLVLPGGMPGTLNLLNSEKVITLVQQMYQNNKWVTAICAAPAVLAKAGILDSKKFTIHPSQQLNIGTTPLDEPIVTDGKLITGRASGSSLPFAFKLVEVLFGKEKVTAINKGVLA